MPEKVIESLDVAVEGGGVDILVEVIQRGATPYANISTTGEDPEMNLSAKDVQGVRDLMHSALTLMVAATPSIEKFFYDAIRLLIVTHYDGEATIQKIEDQGGLFDVTDLFDRNMLSSRAIGDSGEYDTHLTMKGRIHIEQAFKRVQKAGV